MTTSQVKQHFEGFLKSVDAYHWFVSELDSQCNTTFDKHFYEMENNYKYPGLLIKYSFTWLIHNRKSSQDNYEYMNSINEKWLSYIEKNHIPDMTLYSGLTLTV